MYGIWTLEQLGKPDVRPRDAPLRHSRDYAVWKLYNLNTYTITFLQKVRVKWFLSQIISIFSIQNEYGAFQSLKMNIKQPPCALFITVQYLPTKVAASSINLFSYKSINS